jgi:hypothetical protein
MKLKDMIIKITFTNGVRMFGNSYKPWEDQVEEYMRRNAKAIEKPLKVEISRSKFITWGGLKWCSEDDFQQELNREGCQYGEPDNKDPRQYSNMLFENADEKTFNTVLDLWRSGQNLMKVNELSDDEYELYSKGKLKIVID